MAHYSPVVSALVTMLLTIILLASKIGKTIQDFPNERSLHEEPIPRIGGVGLMAGIFCGWVLVINLLAWWIVIPAILLFGVSLLDDVRGLPVVRRLFAHFIAAFMLVLGSGVLWQDVALALAVLLYAVWMTNLYNFMDGSDGLAGGMAFFGFSMYGVAALMHGDDTQAMLNFSVGAAALGFLYYNAHPAKVFMGDAGAIPLGFLSAAMGVWGWQSGHWPAWFPPLVFSPFIADATVTLVKRTLRGAKITEAHREHYYQRLVQVGWGHRYTAFLGYVLMFAAGVSAIWAMRTSPDFPWLVFLIWGGIYTLLMLALDRSWKTFCRNRHE
ncbi:MAG: glycosyltransferase family 4 protein [Nitrosomonadales bacterium]|nr:glycosyltransferase family 4 protein [Nitrosomonadales bacterium]